MGSLRVRLIATLLCSVVAAGVLPMAEADAAPPNPAPVFQSPLSVREETELHLGWYSLASLDANADGNLDVAAIGARDDRVRLSVLLNQGDGTFGAPSFATEIPVHPGHWHPGYVYWDAQLIAADVDDDGNGDLVAVSTSWDGALVFEGDGTGGFAEPVQTPGVTTGTVRAGQIDGTPTPELVLLDGSASTLRLVFGAAAMLITFDCGESIQIAKGCRHLATDRPFV